MRSDSSSHTLRQTLFVASPCQSPSSPPSIFRPSFLANLDPPSGLGWQALAASRVTPFWQNLYSAAALPFPGFAVSLSRFINVPNASSIEPGGSLTFGYLNASLYSSEINYVPIPTGAESYWVVRMDQVAVNGSNVTSWGSGNGQYVAIDTGTTLIGGPKEVVASVYAEIQGASAATGAYTGAFFCFFSSFSRVVLTRLVRIGYYSYPCDTNVSVALTFGGVVRPLSPPSPLLFTKLFPRRPTTCPTTTSTSARSALTRRRTSRRVSERSLI